MSKAVTDTLAFGYQSIDNTALSINSDKKNISVVFIPKAEAATAAMAGHIEVPLIELLNGYGVNKLLQQVKPIAGRIAVPLAVGTALLDIYNSPVKSGNNAKIFAELGQHNQHLVPSSSSMIAANPYGFYDMENPLHVEEMTNIARGMQAAGGDVNQAKVELFNISRQKADNVTGRNRLDIDPEAGKPKILITPLPPVGKPDILSTPDERDKIGRLTELPGFHPPSVEELADSKEGFDLHQTDWRDLILYNDSSGFDPSKEGNHGKVKLSFQYGKIYQDAKDPKTWYSKERSGDRAHGGEHWKRFEQQNKKLIEVGAIDMNGKVMNRNVGKNPVIIDIKNLKGIK